MPQYCVAQCLTPLVFENLSTNLHRPPVGHGNSTFSAPIHPTNESKGSKFAQAILGKFGKLTPNLNPSPLLSFLASPPPPIGVHERLLAVPPSLSTISCHILDDYPPTLLWLAALDLAPW